MKQLRLLGWLTLSLGIGKGLNAWLHPLEPLRVIAIYLLPLIVLGWQQEVVTRQKSLGICQHRLKVESITEIWPTFWGIRFGAIHEVERRIDWLPDTELSRFVEGTTSVLVQILPLFLTGIPKLPIGRLRSR